MKRTPHTSYYFASDIYPWGALHTPLRMKIQNDRLVYLDEEGRAHGWEDTELITEEQSEEIKRNLI